MKKGISRRDFLKGTVAGAASVAAAGILGACANSAAATTAAPDTTAAPPETQEATTAAPETTAPAETEAPAAPEAGGDGKYVTKAMGHESWVYVATTLADGKIAACQVLSHEETIGIGNYACARIPAAIVANQSVNVPNLRGASTTSLAIKAAVSEAITLAGYKIDDFSAEIARPVNSGEAEEEADVVIMGAGTAGLVCAARLLEAGFSVTLVEKRDIAGGSMAMTYGGVATAGSKLQTNYDVDGAYAASPMGTLDGMMNFWKSSEQYHRKDFFNGEMPYMTTQYTYAGDLVDWMHGMGIGFNTLGTYESATAYGASTPYLAPGCYEGGAGYALMFLEQRIGKYEKGKIIYSTSVTELIQDENGRVTGVRAEGEDGMKYTITGKAVCLASGGYAKNKEMLQQYNEGYADFFYNCASASTGEGIQMGLAAGGVMECENRPLPAFLSSYKSKFELAFIHSTAPGIMVNINGDNIGNIMSDNHYKMASAKLNKDNGDTFYYIFDEASAVMLRDSESYGFNGYVAMFEKEEAVHYDSVEAASAELNLPNLAAAIEANNKAALSGEADEFGRKNCPYIETRTGLWAIRVDPTFYLTTAGLAIDTECHVLNAERNAIPGLYAAGDVCGSIEEKDAKQYGMGFDAALVYGYIMGETLKKEL
ncbi:MAG: FAD-dependent oxidoreductase [Lachnospiraceae bacterium]|nr:FAD-dependent oxidoreductase [Lachnospiraceae bacterium]